MAVPTAPAEAQRSVGTPILMSRVGPPSKLPFVFFVLVLSDVFVSVPGL